MNADILKGKWKQIRGQAKQWWGDLTDDDLDTIDGSMDKLVGSLQERYGYAKEEAEQEINRRLKTFQDRGAMAGKGTTNS
jgi:uncharacterized protein YjbJ (UPF0337 family)